MVTKELLATRTLCPVFGFRVRDGLELQIVEIASPTALKGDDVVNDIALAALTYLSGSRTGRYLAKFTNCRRIALDSPMRISWTRRALPAPKWAAQQDQN